MFLCFTPVVTSHCRLVDIYYFIEWSRAPALPMKCYWTTLIFNANTQTRVDGCVEVTCLGQLGAWSTVRAFFPTWNFIFWQHDRLWRWYHIAHLCAQQAGWVNYCLSTDEIAAFPLRHMAWIQTALRSRSSYFYDRTFWAGVVTGTQKSRTAAIHVGVFFFFFLIKYNSTGDECGTVLSERDILDHDHLRWLPSPIHNQTNFMAIVSVFTLNQRDTRHLSWKVHCAAFVLRL